MKHDKAITRAAARGDVDYLLFGKKWKLERGGVYAVRFDRKRIGKSKIVKVGQCA